MIYFFMRKLFNLVFDVSGWYFDNIFEKPGLLAIDKTFAESLFADKDGTGFDMEIVSGMISPENAFFWISKTLTNSHRVINQ